MSYAELKEEKQFIEIRVKVNTTVFSDKSSGFFITSVTSPDVEESKLSDWGNFVLMGNGIELQKGMDYTVKGFWKWNPAKRSWGFCYEEPPKQILPDSRDGIKAYLTSNMFKGIGPKMASRIVDRFGNDTLKILEIHPERLKEIEGIGDKKYQEIIANYKSDKNFEKVSLFLMSYGISQKKVVKIYEAFGTKTEEVVRQNPYILYEKIDGFGFLTADDIGVKLGFEKDNFSRLRAGILYVLQTAVSSQGHLYLPKMELQKNFRKLFRNEIEDHSFQRVLLNMIKHEDVIQDKDETGLEIIYLPSFYRMERFIARKIISLKANTRIIPDLDKMISDIQKEDNITYAEKQIEALQGINKGDIFVITGGPGTGKSTIIKAVIKIFKRNKKNTKILCAAPTGRASKRMEEATGYKSSTIHRLLECDPMNGFKRNSENPLDADVLIIDEMSMVAIDLMYALLSAIKKGTVVILVGDIDQLPPVGAGYILRDLINSNVVPVIKLNQVFRQGEGSPIKLNAQKIREGEHKLEQVPEQFELNMMAYEKSMDLQPFQQIVLKSFCKCITEEYNRADRINEPIYNIQVLVPTWKGKIGAFALNSEIQKIYNPENISKPQLKFMNKDGTPVFYRVGDKVMQIKNDYSAEWERGTEAGEGIFNGDLGIITSINQLENSTYLTVTFEDDKKVKYEKSDIRENLIHAYATSVHKSQGSEYRNVIVICSSAHTFMLARNSIYTAITRAKKKVIIVGDYKALAVAIKTIKSIIRYSKVESLLKVFNQK